MSGNQKQAAAGGPQTQRYSSTSYPFPGADGYVSQPPGTYVPNQGNQGGNQGPGLRTISSVPPNQAPTPPNDLKVQTIPQQSSMNPPMFVPQAVRTPAYFPQRTTAPSNQTPRMTANHNNRAIYQTAPFLVQQQPAMYLSTQQYYGNRPPPMMPSTALPFYMPSQPPYPVNSSHPQASSVPLYNMFISRTGSLPPTQSAIPNPNPSPMSVQMPPNNIPHQSFNKQFKRRPKALKIIDPDTGADRLQEMFEDNSHPPSGESSARQTPQPASYNHTKEVQATFAKQVMQAINTDIDHTRLDEGDRDHHSHSHPHQHPHSQHTLTQHSVVQHQDQLSTDQVDQNYTPQPAVQNIDHIVQSSSFNAMAKEFVLSSNTAKETPIVSANCDAIEVTLPKLPKDRESPVKGRKRETHHQQQLPKETKEILSKEIKEVDVKTKDSISNMNASTTTSSMVSSASSSKDSLEKKIQKKDTKVESKGPDTEYDVSLSSSQQPSPMTNLPDINSNSKNKQSAQRLASKHNLPQNNAPSSGGSKPIPAVVPPPQPPKLSNKTHKRNELNQKGANKEGTDMDAFNDNVTKIENANNSNNTTLTDIINANNNSTSNVSSTPSPSSQVVANNNTVINNEINSKKAMESNETAMTIKSTVPSAPVESVTTVKSSKPKIDVTDIVKDRPKTIKPFNNSADGHDETDRALVNTTDQLLIQVKNEVNAKSNNNTSSSTSGGGDIKSVENKLPYQDGQWTPINQTGLKIYQKEFLLALRNVPCSKVKPDNIPDTILADGRGQLSDGRASMGGRTDFTNPPFTNYGGKSGSRGSLISKRPSAGKMVQGVKTKSTKLSISVKEDVKLHEVENAWRPGRLNKVENISEEEKKTEELNKKVRGVLNKLTPQKFDTLLSQIKALKIDTPERLQGVIDLVFDKAVDEPNFSVAYALMCKELALMQVPTANSTEEKPEYVNFRKLLITRCQAEFEKQSMDETIRNDKLKEIEECTDPEKKKDLQFDLEEYDRKLRMKSVGNIRFIGELFKQNMLTVNIMLRCLNNLLDNKDEESLECLCKLLTTIGKELELSKNVSLSQIFQQMKNIADKKDGTTKISSRIRFMLQDVIDLRNSKWIPRRQDLNPKTIDQIQKEADNEQMNIQIMNSVSITPRKDERVGQSNNSDRKAGRGGRTMDNDGWVTKSNRTFSVQSDKLKTKAPTIDEPLGSSAMWGSWGKGSVVSNTKTLSQQPMGPNTGNMYAALENMDSEKRNIGARSKEPYSSKGPSMERNFNKYEGRGSRSGSQHRSNDNSTSSSQRSTPAPIVAPSGAVPVAPQKSLPAVVQPVAIQLTEEQIDRRIENSLEEYIGGNCTVDEYYLEISSCVPNNYYSKMIANSYLKVLEKSQHMRLKTGELFAKLIQQGRIDLEDYCTGLEEILAQADDLKIDIPKFWDYLADILVDVICMEALPLERLRKSLTNLISLKDSAKIIAPLFKLIINKEGPGFLHMLWKKSGLQLTDFVESSQVDKFITDNQFEFLLSGSAPAIGSNLSYEEIHAKLKEFFKNDADIDEISNWITVHLGERVKDVKFIRTLATAIFEDCIVNKKVQTDRLTDHNNILLKYVDNNPKFELECLYALQALIHKLEHPQGALLAIIELLYDLGTASQESLVTWEHSTDPAEQEGKGVALKQLVSFFTRLKENDDEFSEDDA